MTASAYLAGAARLIEETHGTEIDDRADAAVEAIAGALGAAKPLLVCGNGGSAADAMHITGELVGRYLKERPAYRAIALGANPAVLTAWSNDYDYDTVFARQVEGLGERGGVLLALSTSGNSANVIEALKAARALGMTTIALTGEGGGRAAPLADILLAVPSRATPRIQEVHVCLYHYICQRVEEILTDQ